MHNNNTIRVEMIDESYKYSISLACVMGYHVGTHKPCCTGISMKEFETQPEVKCECECHGK